MVHVDECLCKLKLASLYLLLLLLRNDFLVEVKGPQQCQMILLSLRLYVVQIGLLVRDGALANLYSLDVLLDLVIDGDSNLLAQRDDGTDQGPLLSHCPLKPVTH